MKDNDKLVTAILDAGDGEYKEWNDYGDRKEEFTFKLGVKKEADTCGLRTTVRPPLHRQKWEMGNRESEIRNVSDKELNAIIHYSFLLNPIHRR